MILDLVHIKPASAITIQMPQQQPDSAGGSHALLQHAQRQIWPDLNSSQFSFWGLRIGSIAWQRLLVEERPTTIAFGLAVISSQLFQSSLGC
jgi:hypothetical protein